MEKEKKYANGLRDGKAKAPECFTVLELSKESITYGLEGTNAIRPMIDKLTEKQMEDIAEDVSDQLFSHYWEALELAVNAELEGQV